MKLDQPKVRPEERVFGITPVKYLKVYFTLLIP